MRGGVVVGLGSSIVVSLSTTPAITASQMCLRQGDRA